MAYTQCGPAVAVMFSSWQYYIFWEVLLILVIVQFHGVISDKAFRINSSDQHNSGRMEICHNVSMRSHAITPSSFKPYNYDMFCANQNRTQQIVSSMLSSDGVFYNGNAISRNSHSSMKTPSWFWVYIGSACVCSEHFVSPFIHYMSLNTSLPIWISMSRTTGYLFTKQMGVLSQELGKPLSSEIRV